MSGQSEEPNKPVEPESILPIDEHVEPRRPTAARSTTGASTCCRTCSPLPTFRRVLLDHHGDQRQFYVAAATVFVAMVLDSLDGRVARLTNTQSAFGAEYDSLSDMVAFGLAPAVLAYEWALSGLGNVGLTVAFIYVACAALRLARFNTQIGKVDKRWFIGLASPAAAGVVAGWVWAVWALDETGIRGVDLPLVLVMLFALMVAAAGLLMVSNIKYYSFRISI